MPLAALHIQAARRKSPDAACQLKVMLVAAG
jgi:hypothetical protein